MSGLSESDKPLSQPESDTESDTDSEEESQVGQKREHEDQRDLQHYQRRLTSVEYPSRSVELGDGPWEMNRTTLAPILSAYPKSNRGVPLSLHVSDTCSMVEISSEGCLTGILPAKKANSLKVVLTVTNPHMDCETVKSGMRIQLDNGAVIEYKSVNERSLFKMKYSFQPPVPLFATKRPANGGAKSSD